MGIERSVEDVEVVPSVRPLSRGSRRLLVEPLAKRGLVDHVRQLVFVELVRQVDDCPRDGGDRNAPPERDVAGVEALALMNPHPGT